MVSNFERILGEIRREANLAAAAYGLNPLTVVDLIMQVVDLEDQHRIRSVARIQQKVKGMIQTVALEGDGGENI